jgi:hypothetical protein
MSANGERRPPRPRIEFMTEPASESEAAAIVSALEQFLAETTPAPAESTPVSRWQRAALEQGVWAHDLTGHVWGRLERRL